MLVDQAPRLVAWGRRGYAVERRRGIPRAAWLARRDAGGYLRGYVRGLILSDEVKDPCRMRCGLHAAHRGRIAVESWREGVVRGDHCAVDLLLRGKDQSQARPVARVEVAGVVRLEEGDERSVALAQRSAGPPPAVLMASNATSSATSSAAPTPRQS